MNNKLVLIIGLALIAFSYSDIDLNLLPWGNIEPSASYVVDPPSDETLLVDCKNIVGILQQYNGSTSRQDCIKLSSLFYDMSVLLSLDNNDKVISSTEDILNANTLAGKMLGLNIKGKYPGLAEVSEQLLTNSIGKENVTLNEDLRQSAVEAFQGLSWAFYQGSK